MRLQHRPIFGLLASVASLANAYEASRHLWHDFPGDDFNSAFAIGNGRLGALMYGSASEKIVMNENSVWSGLYSDRTNPAANEGFKESRELLKNGKMTEAGQVVLRDMTGTPSSTSRSYSVTSNLVLDFGHDEEGWSNYERWLDTLNGNMGVKYTFDGVDYTREAIANYPTGVTAFHLTASEDGSLNVRISLERSQGIEDNTANAESRTINMKVGGDDAGSIAFYSGLRVVADGGSIDADGEVLVVSDANSVEIYYDTETEFQWSDEDGYRAEVGKKLDAAESKGFESLKTEAVEDHSQLMNRVKLDLGAGDDAKNTEQRRLDYKDSPESDNAFITLMFNFGRHLLVSSSRDTGGSGLGVPANLQGLWNDNYTPPWGSKYTVNINTEMNYWLAEITNLQDTLRPLWDLMDRSREKGSELAQSMYGCDGYVTHHNLDIWGDPNPHDNGTQWSMWPMSNLWLLNQMVDHYRFTGDKGFLQDRAWPLLQAAGQFFDCYLFEFEGYTSSGPSSSPENAFVVPSDMDSSGKSEAIDISPTMDDSLLYEFLSNYMMVADVLGSSDDFVDRAQTLRDGLRPAQIGKHGQLQEWRLDYEESEAAHRHYSHLYDLFPGTGFTPLVNESLADASRVSIERRLDAGGASTGWSRSWTAMLYARLLDGPEALRQTRILLQRHPMKNLFTAIEGSTFQIDSNFGCVTAVAEMLVQSQNGLVHLLPAWAGTKNAGSVSGLTARGSFEVTQLTWDEEGTLGEAKIKSRIGGELKVRVADGSSIQIDGQDTDTVDTTEGQEYTVTLA